MYDIMFPDKEKKMVSQSTQIIKCSVLQIEERSVCAWSNDCVYIIASGIAI